MSGVQPHAPLLQNDQPEITVDIICVGCGYNLRGLTPNAACPECALPVARSQHSNLLRHSNPEWLDRLTSGTSWLTSWLCVTAVVVIIGIVNNHLARSTILLMEFLAGTLGVVACWKLTTPELTKADDSPTLRTLLRVLSFVGLCLVVAAEGIDRSGSPLLQSIVESSGELVGIPLLFATFAYARQLAMRIPEINLARRTRIVMWGVGLFYGFFIVWSILIELALRLAIFGYVAPGSWLEGAGGFIVGNGILFIAPGLFGFVFFGIWSLLLLYRYRRALREAAVQARATWAREQPAATNS